MDPTQIGANGFTAEELDELFSDEYEEKSPAPDEDNSQTDEGTKAGNEGSNVENTKAFAKRLKESTDKARRDEREIIAKSLGYESYDDMLKKREQKIVEDSGLDPNDVTPIVEKIIQQRLENDPRMLELENLKNNQLKEFAKTELATITKLTNGEITSLAQLPREVIELWKQKGSLKSAYMELEGEKLITKIRGEQSKGSTAHLQNPGGSNPGKVTQRHLTAEEKNVWRLFNPNMSEEDLNKKLIDV